MAGVTLSPSHEPPRKRKGTGHTDQTVEKLKEGGYGGGGGGGGARNHRPKILAPHAAENLMLPETYATCSKLRTTAHAPQG